MTQQPFPRVSVIIPVYNDAERLQVCLQALEVQTYPEALFEVLVVDNGSSESLEQVVRLYPHARLSFESQQSSYAARNTGITLARGEVLAFTDSDCIPAPTWLEMGVKHLLRTPNCGLLGGKVDIFFQNPHHPTTVELYDCMMHLRQKMYIEDMKFSATANLFTFAQVFRQVGNFDPLLKSGGDREWGRRVFLSGYALFYADDVRVAHPARRSLEQLCRKQRRISRGELQLQRKIPISGWVRKRDLVIRFIPPLITVARLQQVPFEKKLQILGIWVVLRTVEVHERLCR